MSVRVYTRRHPQHFALDLGLDRTDVVAALDGYGTALERRVDLPCSATGFRQ
jgi:hypothetical protein